jgi:hypothetical protein
MAALLVVFWAWLIPCLVGDIWLRWQVGYRCVANLGGETVLGLAPLGDPWLVCCRWFGDVLYGLEPGVSYVCKRCGW